MKTFTKGTLTTIVDDDDHRIPSYLASGWKEISTAEKKKEDADKRIDKAIGEANENDSNGAGKGGGKGAGKGKNSASDKKVNDAVAATKMAEVESEAIDDGLIKTEAVR